MSYADDKKYSDWLLFAGICFCIFQLQLCHVEVLVDDLGNWLDFSAQLLLYAVQREAVIVGDQVDGDAEVAKAAGSANAVQIRLCHLWEVKVDHHVHSLYVYASREEVRADKVPAEASAEVVEHAVTMLLGHLGVDVVAGVAKLGYLLGQELHPLSGVAEDD